MFWRICDADLRSWKMGDPVPDATVRPGAYAKRVHGVVFVVPASMSQLALGEDLLERVRLFQKRLKELGVPFVVAMTKPDEVDDSLTTDRAGIALLPASTLIADARKKLAGYFGGMDVERVLPVMTYHTVKDKSPALEELAVKMLEKLFTILGNSIATHPQYKRSL